MDEQSVVVYNEPPTGTHVAFGVHVLVAELTFVDMTGPSVAFIQADWLAYSSVIFSMTVDSCAAHAVASSRAAAGSHNGRCARQDLILRDGKLARKSMGNNAH